MDSFQKWRDWLVIAKDKVYTDHQGLQYFNTKQKLNLQETSWYLHICLCIHHVYYSHGFKMSKPDSGSGCLGTEKSRMDVYIFDQEQWRKLENNNVGDGQDTADVELEGIDIATCEKKN